MAGASAERQENKFVKDIQDAVKKNQKNPITVEVGSVKIHGVIDAKKYSGRQESGSEPYTDVILILKNKKTVNLSLKGDAAPSLAGGGLRGLEAIVPGLASRFMSAAYNQLIKNGLKSGDKVPDVYGKIGPATKTKVVVGNKKMGGPIDYMYVGGMNVASKYDDKKNVLSFTNGKLTEATEYAKKHDLYFRLRARREDQRFDPDAKADNTPKIYGKSPSRGDSAGRIVVTNSVPSSAVVVPVR